VHPVHLGLPAPLAEHPIVVVARRTVSAGTTMPSPIATLWLGSSWLTSGFTFSRITSPAIVGRNVSLTPNSL